MYTVRDLMEFLENKGILDKEIDDLLMTILINEEFDSHGDIRYTDAVVSWEPDIDSAFHIEYNTWDSEE